MFELTLPPLTKLWWKNVGSKNIVQQLLAHKYVADFNFISTHRSYTVIESNEEQYCLTCNSEIIPEEFDYVLFTDKRATQERLEGNSVKIKKWLKHPKQLEHSVQDIISSWDDEFKFIEENIETGVYGLREPQIAALYSVMSHFRVTEDIGTVVMPTGTGKTETMLAALVANKCPKVLITVPSDALRSQLANKFYQLGLLKRFGIVGEDSLFPRVGVLYENIENIETLKSFIDSCNVLVTTMNLLANNTSEQLSVFASKFTNIFIDEAHHIEANSWKNVRKAFNPKHILQFTATPFRNDRKRLDGKIIFNFSLKKAQEQGYFKPITFSPIREYDLKKGDRIIADKAVAKLREDLENHHNHIMMARCKDKTRAKEIFDLYKEHEDLNPVMIHSSVKGKRDLLKAISIGEHRIIVAVDMLGEGFDLPQLKIAAFHDIRKSLPITLQFAGRFTRTSADEELGGATFFANLADSNTEDELSELYAQDSDWNLLLSTLSSDEIEEQLDFDEFISGFQHLENSQIPFQNIRFAQSTVVYKNTSESGSVYFNRFKQGFGNYEELEYKHYDYNPNEKTLVVITASKAEVDWVNYKEVFGLNWQLTVIYYDEELNLLYIHSSDKTGLYKELANAVLNGHAELINQVNVFKAFFDIKRVSLQNVGLKEFLNRKIRFTMRVGTDIEDALSIAEQQRGQKAFVFGSGYENGNKITLGCSYKGRIWSYFRSDLKGFTGWCKNIGAKLINEGIDPNQVLRQTLIPEIITDIPQVSTTHIDWDDNFYEYPENKIYFQFNNHTYALSHCSISLVESEIGTIIFEIITPSGNIRFQKELYTDQGEDGNYFANFRVVQLEDIQGFIVVGSRTIPLLEYFNSNPPIIWFADGAALQGNEYVELKHVIQPYPTDNLIAWNWEGVNLSNEAQGVNPLITDSIQYKVIQNLLLEDYDIIYDDDYSGEIADLITIKEYEREIRVKLFHLKFAKNGQVNTRIDNFYEVCGQAQKSIHWKHKKGTEFFEHLLRRRIKVRNGHEKDRLEKGNEHDLEHFLAIAKNRKPMNFEVYIVQPSLSQRNVSDDIMTLLGVTDNYLKEVGNINLSVIVNE